MYLLTLGADAIAKDAPLLRSMRQRSHHILNPKPQPVTNACSSAAPYTDGVPGGLITCLSLPESVPQTAFYATP